MLLSKIPSIRKVLAPVLAGLCAGLTACGGQTQSYPMMGSISETPMQEGYIGCEWTPHEVKLTPPLSGKLKFTVTDCSGDGFRPQYGYNLSFENDGANGILLNRYPLDPKYANQAAPNRPFLFLHHNPDQDIRASIEKIALDGADDDCVIGETTSGEWQIGFPKAYFLAQGVEIISHAEAEGQGRLFGSNLLVADDDDFPVQALRFACLNSGNDLFLSWAYRSAGPIIFEYYPHLIRTNEQSFIDPYSVQVVLRGQ